MPQTKHFCLFMVLWYTFLWTLLDILLSSCHYHFYPVCIGLCNLFLCQHGDIPATLFSFLLTSLYFWMPDIDPRVSCMEGKCSIAELTKLHLWPIYSIFNFNCVIAASRSHCVQSLPRFSISSYIAFYCINFYMQIWLCCSPV